MTEVVKEDFGDWPNYETQSVVTWVGKNVDVRLYVKSIASGTATREAKADWLKAFFVKMMNTDVKLPSLSGEVIEHYTERVDWALIIEKAKAWE
jgi:hypothetical protein